MNYLLILIITLLLIIIRFIRDSETNEQIGLVTKNDSKHT